MIGPTGVWQNGDCAPPGQAHQLTFHEGGSSKFTEVGYVGRDVESMIRDRSRSPWTWCVRKNWKRWKTGPSSTLKSACSTCCCRLLLLPRPAAVHRARWWSMATASPRRARRATTVRGKSCGNSSAKASWMTALWKSMYASAVRRRLEIISNPGHRGDGYQPQGCAAQPVWPADQEAQDEGRRGVEYLVQEEETRLVDMDQVRGWRSSGWRIRGLSSWTRSIRFAGREGGHGPDVSREGCREIFCPSLKGPRSIPDMGWYGPTIFSSSQRGRFTFPSQAI